MFFFDFGNYFRMLRLAWNEPVAKARHRYLMVLLLAVPFVSSFHAICFALDYVFFPGLRNVNMKDPVFMVGHARSGTTLTHRLMSQDEGRFSFFLLYECYFPSLLQKKLIRWGIAFDENVLGGLLARQAQKFEEWRYGGFRHIHAMGLTVPEEDDISLYYSMASGFWITRLPYMGDLDFFHMNEWSPAKRGRYNDFYREVVRRQLYLNGPGKTHLAKNPLWSGRVESLIEAFPGARIIVNVRDPRETIPSLISLMRASWKSLGWEEDRMARCLSVLVDQSWATYMHPLESLDAHPETRGSVVDYRELTSDPAAAIEQVYKDLEIEMTDSFREHLAAQGKRERKHSVKHDYSLEQFGLEADAIEQNLASLFDRFQWKATDAPVDEPTPAGAE